ncbi:MAG: Asp-tRNA(Asn)/Glu-tRNA(Gln) amidotransferase subunit GatB [Oscillospiraceae bacterium]|nr:Asp-tRNA(Asn)/Glu-tRNA(Gln) amidotransferase subunit GatB [Oscillospiraceae bacterium]
MEDRIARWETVIGLETHVELATERKLFCSCSAAFGAPANQNCCPLCLGEPGVRPVLNEKAVELAVRGALALGCRVETVSVFDRKHYSSPDLPRGYQITQFYRPLARDGAVRITPENGQEHTVHIAQVHLEDDAGRLFHDWEHGDTRVDFNRSGVPLIEIVTRPDFRNGDEVVAYLEELKTILQYLGVSDCKLQEGSLRCDVNLSVRPEGSTELGTRTEMKNLGSFRAVRRAIEYESRRQIALLERGERVVQETRRWDEDRNESISMRSKEDARDYHYFPEPDLPPLVLSEEYLLDLRARQPELPGEKRARYSREYGLPDYDARMLTGQRALAEFFERTVALGAQPKQAANWIMGQVLRQLSQRNIGAEHMSLSPEALVKILALVEEGRINRNTAVQVFDAVFDGGDPEQYVKANRLEQVSDTGLVERAVERVIRENPGPVSDFRAGKEKSFGFLVGQTMRLLGGKADPKTINIILKNKLVVE